MKVYFIGAGPGDPELITVKGSRILSEADVVIYAGSLVSPEVLSWCRKDAVIMDSASMDLEEVCRVYGEKKDQGGTIVRLHTGDPSLFGAIQEQMEYLRAEEIDYEIIPGVSSFQAAAAALEQEYTLPGVSQSLIISRVEGRTPVPEKEDLEVLAKSRATMALFLSIAHIDRVCEKLLTSYPEETPAAIVYRASWPDQKILRSRLGELAQTVKESGITRQALIIVGDVLDQNFEYSKLYDPAFSHGWRKGRLDEGAENGEESGAESGKGE